MPLRTSPYIETYKQTLEIVFTTRAAARRAVVKPLPLFDGRAWAISTRWDDNNLADSEMADVLAKHGYKGTFYFNAFAPHEREELEKLEKRLLEAGNSIGGHSWSHPYLTYCNRNAMFEEVLRIRAAREASSDSAICSYAFSFCDFFNPLEGETSRNDIAELLFRAGYYHAANALFVDNADIPMLVSNLLPPDGMAPIDEPFANLLSDDRVQRAHPNISFNMHVWYAAPEQWEQFEAELDRYGSNPAWWYCNQSEYAAYRRQCLDTVVEADRRGKRLEVTLVRPCLQDLADAVPLTLEVQGASPAEITSINAPKASLERSDTAANVRFHLYHDQDQRLPRTIGFIPNDHNYATLEAVEADPHFPGIRGFICKDGNALRLTLRNDSSAPLTEAVATYRLPLAYADGVIRRPLPDVPAQTKCVDLLRLEPATWDPKYHAGSAFYLAQIDFMHDSEAARLHLTCNTPPQAGGPSYPQAGFLKLGPIPHRECTVGLVKRAARSGLEAVRLENGRELCWEPTPFGATVNFDPEVVHTTGYWLFLKPDLLGCYLLRTTVNSAKAQQAVLRYTDDCLEAIFVNGAKLDDNAVRLNKGENHMTIAYATTEAVYDYTDFDTVYQALRPSNAGFFLRLTDPETSRRLTNVRFIQPSDPDLALQTGLGM